MNFINKLQSSISGIWQRNHDLLHNAGSLAATTGVTSVFGFAYWIFAARVFSQSAVGYGSAAVSAMTLLGTVGMFGLGTVLIGELPRRAARGGLVSAALFASAIGSLILGLGFALIALAFGSHFVEIDGTPVRIAIFAFGVALTGATLVFDEATIGLLRGGVQLARNVALAVTKMAVLPVTALLLHDAFGVGILVAWIAGTVLSLVPVVIMLRRSGSRIAHRPDWRLLRSLGKVAMAHNWLNLAIAVPPKLIPVLVMVVVSPSANAAFYVAFMLASFLFMVPAHLSTVLFAIASATPEVIAEKLRFVLRLSLAIGIPVMLALGVGAHLALSVFGANYAKTATLPLWLLLLQYLPNLPKAQYIAVCRATGQVTKAAVVLTGQACAELAAVVVGGKMDGLDGLCFALLVVSVFEGLMTAPTVFRAAAGRAHLPIAEGTLADTMAGLEPVAAATAISGLDRADYQRRQHVGLAALITIATSVTPDTHAYDTVIDAFPAISLTSAPVPAPRRGRHRRGAALTVTDMPVVTDQDVTASVGTKQASTTVTAPPGDDLAYRLRQQAGLAALAALATRTVQFLSGQRAAAFQVQPGAEQHAADFPPHQPGWQCGIVPHPVIQHEYAQHTAGEPGRDLVPGSRVLHRYGGQRRGAARTIGPHLPRQLGQVGAVEVRHDRGRLVREPVPGEDHAHEHVEILAATGRRARAKRLVEATELFENRAGHREIRSRAEDAGGVRVERGVIAVIRHVEQPRLAYGPPAFTQVEVELRRVLELGGSDQAGDTGDSGRRPEASHDAIEPPGIDPHVVVGERHDVSGGLRDAAVAGAGQARTRLAHVTDPRIAAELRAHGRFRRVRTRRVVDHHDLERTVAQGG